ncbi:hypothetical protein [Congregibacter litoralis]|uniref:Uncharacterized protein n=1 Tax=Congregibacter litoralis KT71 TaxID=314285 RepID=A4A7D1_9GAMM|nr:hypothetical protein [Congregibacter litoralis]EAQ98200.1 hypothetical protein KT71_03097 [Congregibacter litoralis KT71]
MNHSQSVQPSQSAQTESGRFFQYLAFALLGIVVIGFAPSFFLRFFTEEAPLPLYLHFHGALLTGWFVILCLQASLIRGQRRVIHQKLGPYLMAYAAVVAVAALMATLNYVGRELERGFTLASDMGDVNPLQASGLPFGEFAAALLSFNIASVVGFVVLLAMAVVWRERREHHKRYVMFASLSIIAPGLARISRMVLETEQGPLIPLGLAGLVLAIVVYDFLTLHRAHRATVTAIAILFVLNSIAGLVALSPLGKALVISLA